MLIFTFDFFKRYCKEGKRLYTFGNELILSLLHTVLLGVLWLFCKEQRLEMN